MKNLYEFQDITAKSSQLGLMPEALTFGGINIDKELAGYRTLNVSGRENYTRTINTANSTADGELFISSKIDTAELTIKYQLNADTIDDFNHKFTQLKYWLQGNEVAFYFADENEFVRYGTVTSLVNDNAGTIMTTGTITIKMTDPFRHGQEKHVNGTTSAVINDPQMLYAQPIDKITVSVASDTQLIAVNIDNDYNLTLNGSYTANSTIIIDFNALNVYQNGNSILSNIDITKTNIFEALVSNGNTVTCQQANNISVDYRVRIL